EEALRLVERRVFRHGRLPEAVRQEFWHAFKLATFGLEEKRLAQLLTEFVARHHDLVVDTADPAVWGGEERIWPAGHPWRVTPLDVAATVRTLRQELAA